MEITLPPTGFVHWPVGNGDSTTVCIDAKTLVQVDLNHLASAEDDDDPRTPLLDHLVPLLPKVDGRPYLPLFVLTHPDLDHCRGFAELLKRATIGELWFTPRVFREFKSELCDDAQAFQKVAKRRVKQAIAGKQGAGERVRIIGRDELLEEEGFKGFPKERLTAPGSTITEIDGADRVDAVRIFLHAPFKDDSDGDRNDTSVGMQVTLLREGGEGRALLLGDLCYPTVNRIFTKSQKGDLSWNVFLGPHHCSKSVLYWSCIDDEEETLREDLEKTIETAALSPGYVVLSSEPCPKADEAGDNPPHAKARKRYEEMAPDDVLCTGEPGDPKFPEPIIFEVGKAGLTCRAVTSRSGKTSKAAGLSATVAAARGASEPPSQRVGFGSH